MDTVSAIKAWADRSDGPQAPLSYSIELYRSGDYDALLPWDVHWTIALVEAMRMLSLTKCPVDGEVCFETEGARAAILSHAEDLHKEAVARHCRNLRRMHTRQRVNRLP